MPATLVIVEDNEDLREMLACFLQVQGFTVVAAEDGEAGLRIIRQQPPDLVITDIAMPNMDGLSMIREMRRWPETCSVPVLVLTAYRGKIGDEAIAAGATQAAYKPVQLDALIRVIEQLL
jgi:two-component system, chemotaxis family, chemotaxis protein CheY